MQAARRGGAPACHAAYELLRYAILRSEAVGFSKEVKDVYLRGRAGQQQRCAASASLRRRHFEICDAQMR